MNKTSISVLIIEDFVIVAEAYANILSSIQDYNFEISFANNCDEAIKQIKETEFHIVILDLQIPSSINEAFVCGEDIGLMIKKRAPKTKILVLTNISDYLRVSNILKEINPEGFAIKTEMDHQDLSIAVKDLIIGKRYYSKKIENHIINPIINGYSIDDYDRKILYHLTNGVKTKDISNLIPLSHRAIEDRKNKLKTIFHVKSPNHSNLIMEAKKYGLV